MRWPERDGGAALPAGGRAAPFALEPPAARRRPPTARCAWAPTARSGPRPRSRPRRRCSSCTRSSASSSRPPTPGAWASSRATGSRSRTNGSRVAGTAVRCAPRSRPGTVFLQPTATAATRPTRSPRRLGSWRSASRDARASPHRRLLRALVDPDHQGDRDLRRRPPARARRPDRSSASCSGRFQARYGPNRVGPFGAAPADGRHRQAAGQGAVPPAHLGRLPLRARAADLDRHRGRGPRDHPLRRRRRTSSARRSGSTASTSASARSTCSPSARSPSTGSCSAAGPRARSTRSWAPCARPRSSSPTRSRSGLSLLGVVFTAGTLSLTGIVHAQQGMWYFVPQFVGFLHLHGRGLRGDQPAALRPRRGRRRARPRLQHRVRRRRASPPTTSPSTSTCSWSRAIADHDVPRRLAAALRDRPAGLGRPLRRAREDVRLHHHLHLDPRDAPAPALRPAHELRLEDPAAAGHPQRPGHRDRRGGDGL